MIKAAIFDLDGTLLNTLPSITYFGNAALRKYGFSEIPMERYRYLVGEGAVLLVKRMLQEVGADAEQDFEKVYNEYRTQYDANTAYKTAYYDGILDMLGTMKHYKMKLAVLSNKPQEQVSGVIGSFFPDGVFEKVYGAREDIKRKPDPDGVYRICREIGVKPEECLYLGDTATDMKTGAAAGCLTIGAEWGFRDRKELELHGAAAVASSPMDVLKYI